MFKKMSDFDKWGWLETAKSLSTWAGSSYIGLFFVRQLLAYKIIGIAAVDIIGITKIPLLIYGIWIIREQLEMYESNLKF